jgi:serine/threonine-protein kinase
MKPGNIICTDSNVAKLCDLGLAEPIKKARIKKQQNVTSGTIEYISPEQAKGEIFLDIRSDIYSLGATLYHMVTGDPPENDPLNEETRRFHVLLGLEKADQTSVGISLTTRYFILKMMAENPEDRFQSSEDIATEIKYYLDGLKNLEQEAQELIKKQKKMIRLMREERHNIREEHK